MQRGENSTDIKRGRWSLLVDFSIATTLTVVIPLMIFMIQHVKACPTDFNNFFLTAINALKFQVRDILGQKLYHTVKLFTGNVHIG